MTTIVMPVWGRLELVKKNLESLSNQECEVICVSSIDQDSNFLRELKMPNLHLCYHSNYPLGKKFQAGVDHAKMMGSDEIVILGSDDFLSRDFVKNAHEYAQRYDFIYMTRWYMLDTRADHWYKCWYNKNQLAAGGFRIGSGRVFSKRFLDTFGWHLYDVMADYHLDDFAFNHRMGGEILMNPKGMEVLAIKGSHDTKNSLERILSAHTIDWAPVKNPEIFDI